MEALLQRLTVCRFAKDVWWGSVIASPLLQWERYALGGSFNWSTVMYVVRYRRHLLVVQSILSLLLMMILNAVLFSF